MAQIFQFPTSRTMDFRLAWQREKADPRLGWRRLAEKRALLIIKEPGAGPPCPTCKRPMELRRHRQITDDQLCQDTRQVAGIVRFSDRRAAPQSVVNDHTFNDRIDDLFAS